MNLPDDSARPHHYVFAHQMLPDMLEFPGSLTALVAEGRFDWALRDIWDRLANGLPQDDRLSSEGMGSMAVEVGGMSGVLITLPPAEHWNEAHAVLVAPLDPPEARRFFTLERQLAGSVVPGAMVCEWARGTHKNFGPGPDGSDHDAFVARVAELLS